MKIIKRNGAEENFDPMKIRNAVLGANGNVERESDRLDPEQIAAIVLDVERQCRSRGGQSSEYGGGSPPGGPFL